MLVAAVVLIVLALVFFLVSTILALRKIVAGLDETITAVVEIIEKSAPVEAVVDDINQNLDAAVDALEGLLVKKAGMQDAVGLVEGLYPGAAAAGFRNFPESTTRQGAADLRGLHAGHADAGPARPRGADRGRQPGWPRRCATPSTAATPPASSTPARGPAARRSSAPTRPCNTRNAMQTPAPFDYERATSVEGALAALREHENARIIAGGHSLLPMMKLRLATPSYLVDINDLEDLGLHPRGGRRAADRGAHAPRRAAAVRAARGSASRCSGTPRT